MIDLTEAEQTTLKSIIKNQATDQPYRVVGFGFVHINYIHEIYGSGLSLLCKQNVNKIFVKT
ncbi:MAG: hypothetical protein ACREGF_02730 [Candidatus Saccharimonadales bacterium]